MKLSKISSCVTSVIGWVKSLFKSKKDKDKSVETTEVK